MSRSSSRSRESPWRRAVGSLMLTLMSLALVGYVRTSFAVEGIEILLLLPVIFSSYWAGLTPSLVSTGISIAYLGYQFAPGQPPTTAIVLGVTMLIASLMSHFRLRAKTALPILGLELDGLHDPRTSLYSPEAYIHALQDVEQRYRTIVDHAPAGVLVFKDDGRVLFGNAYAAALLGKAGAEPLIDLDIYSLVDPDQRPLLLDRIEARLREATPDQPIEINLQRDDRSTVTAEWLLTVCVFAEQPCLLALIQDVSATRRHVERLRRIAAATDAGLWDWNIQTDAMYLTPRFCERLGYSAEEFAPTQTVWFTRVHPDDRDVVTAQLRAHLEQQLPFCTALRLLAGNGDWRWIQASGRAQHDSAGRSIWMSGTLVDITELKSTEETSRASAARFQEIANHISDVLWVINGDASKVLYVTPAYEALTGRSIESLYRDINTYFESAHPGDRKSMLNFVATLRLGRNAMAEYRIVRPDGSERWISERGFPIRDPAGAVCRIAGIAVDITDRKQVETSQQARNQGLEADAAARLREMTLLRMDLERRNHESILLNDMNGILQSCMNLDEAYNAFPHTCQRLFPRFAGSLHVLHPSHHYLESVADWGDPLFTDQIFEPQSCWALRRGQCHRYDQINPGVICQHVQPSGKRKAAYLCIPLLAQSEMLGLLYLELHDAEEEAPNNHRILESEILLAASLAEHAALALANIKLRETLRLQSIRDPMTGLYNRRYFEEALLRELARAERKGIPLSIMMLDVDCFNSVNDQYGRTIGDQVLRELAGVLLAYSRISDIACRYGGEEFVLLLSDTGAETAYARAEQLRAAVSALAVQVGDGYRCRVTASIGIATCPDHANRPDSLVKQADHALFLAKRGGRDRVRIADADKVVSLTER